MVSSEQISRSGRRAAASSSRTRRRVSSSRAQNVVHPHYRQVSTHIKVIPLTLSLRFAPCARMTPWRMTPRRSNSAGPNSEEVAGYAVACARPALAIFERERPGDRRPRSAIEAAEAFAGGASGPGCYVTARGRPTERLSRPAMQGRLRRRRCARGRPGGGCGVPPPAAEAAQGQAHPRIGRSCRTSVRTLRRRSRRPDSTRSRSPGFLRLPS